MNNESIFIHDKNVSIRWKLRPRLSDFASLTLSLMHTVLIWLGHFGDVLWMKMMLTTSNGYGPPKKVQAVQWSSVALVKSNGSHVRQDVDSLNVNLTFLVFVVGSHWPLTSTWLPMDSKRLHFLSDDRTEQQWKFIIGPQIYYTQKLRFQTSGARKALRWSYYQTTINTVMWGVITNVCPTCFYSTLFRRYRDK